MHKVWEYVRHKSPLLLGLWGTKLMEGMMGESLYREFLNETLENLGDAILEVGVVGILSQFEQWLETNGYLKGGK